MMLSTSCKIALSNTFCGATAVFEYRRNDRFCMQNARRVTGMLETWGQSFKPAGLALILG